jgi:hypothetical protein
MKDKSFYDKLNFIADITICVFFLKHRYRFQQGRKRKNNHTSILGDAGQFKRF